MAMIRQSENFPETIKEVRLLLESLGFAKIKSLYSKTIGATSLCVDGKVPMRAA